MKSKINSKSKIKACKRSPYKMGLILRGLVVAVLIAAQLSLTVLLAYPCRESPENEQPDNIVTDKIDSGAQEEIESYTFYSKEKIDFLLKGTVLTASFCVNDKGVEITSIKNNMADYEWISGTSFSELVEVYYDKKSVMHNFGWKYFGCYEFETSSKLIFEYKSSDGKFTCRQEWCISKTDADGDVITMSHSIVAPEEAAISLPEKFSGVSFQLCSEEDFYLQYLNESIRDEKVTDKDVIRFSAGIDDGFDMSVPLYYYSAKGVHGVTLGTGVFSPEYSTVTDVAVSKDCLISVTKSEYKVFSGDTGTAYVFPSFFCSVFQGNNSVGKNFIRSWNSSVTADEYGSLPLTYENVVGAMDLQSIEEVRNAFYNMQFFFSVSDIRNNTYGNIINDLSACPEDDINLYNYILRSAMFCDFDYTKVGLPDGTTLKDKAAENDEIYRNKLASVMLNGRQYPVFHEYNDSGWDGIGFYDSLNKKGSVFVFRNNPESDSERNIILQELDPSLEYKIISSNDGVLIDRISGEALLKDGLRVSMKDGAMSDIIFIDVAEVDLADVKILLFGNELSSLETIAIAVVFIFVIGVVIAAIIVSAEDEYTEK